MKRILSLLVLFLCGIAAMQAQDFRITKFQENLLDLSAASSGVRDRNGDACAIIKFSVRDDKFVFEPNMGVVKTERKVGETWLYVPAKTKRISVRHPQLGMLRDYNIPVSIEEKTVYEAEIEITNSEYLKSLLTTKTRTDTIRIFQRKDSIIYKDRVRRYHVIVGVGFSGTTVMGPVAQLGFLLDRHSLEAGVAVGMNKVENMSFYQTDNATFWGTYDFKPLRVFARYGYDVALGQQFVMTPQVGVAYTNITGSEMRRSASGTNLFGKSNVLSATVGLKLGLKLGSVVRLQVVPEFALPVKPSKAYDHLKDVNTKIKSWGGGFNVSGGLTFYI